MKAELEADKVGLVEGDAPKTGSGKSIGTIHPDFIQPKAGSAYFANWLNNILYW